MGIDVHVWASAAVSSVNDSVVMGVFEMEAGFPFVVLAQARGQHRSSKRASPACTHSLPHSGRGALDVEIASAKTCTSGAGFELRTPASAFSSKVDARGCRAGRHLATRRIGAAAGGIVEKKVLRRGWRSPVCTQRRSHRPVS